MSTRQYIIGAVVVLMVIEAFSFFPNPIDYKGPALFVFRLVPYVIFGVLFVLGSKKSVLRGFVLALIGSTVWILAMAALLYSR